MLIGGPGDDMLAGGRLSDTFVFAPNEGSDRVLDLEAWDSIDLIGFGYANDAQGNANITQQGGDLVFTDQGTTVTFADTGLGQISNDMIGV